MLGFAGRVVSASETWRFNVECGGPQVALPRSAKEQAARLVGVADQRRAHAGRTDQGQNGQTNDAREDAVRGEPARTNTVQPSFTQPPTLFFFFLFLQNPGFDFSGAEFNGALPENPQTFMDDIKQQ